MAIAEQLADIAGRVIRPAFRQAFGIADKDDHSPVTEVDEAAEQAMRAELARLRPQDGIVGEEFGAGDLDRDGLTWVLDPIDGTRAFITGRPTFGTLVALLDGGRPVLGVIDQPVTRERWVGVVGRPTVFTGAPGGAAGCRPCPGLAAAELSCTSPEMFTDRDLTSWSRLRAQVRRTSYGGDCYAYGLLALGQIDVIAEATMKLWDWAALVPVIEGAGGCVTDWNGRALTPASDGHVLAVGDPGLLAPALRALDA